ncbi:type II toxin-antitoxin system MqsA family antitoxin [Sulfurovum sp. bin170]|uniref:type II toxin-antitoxin system MqsA family antitoxin n=1 Tax=Sulfurovum sp. bin170 TaxID=2695268 RepID=UPI0013DF2D5E|nr:type II toxin-antitoxin system MqsA family antitoxin [Sulfurovum sp. bin170]NEW60028.1 type II toxin-antitoxin system MqsA family antitoxin [Sulfurovum sp. bin170]
MKVCPICDGEIKREERTIVYRYKEHTRDIQQMGDYCIECQEGFLSPRDLKFSQKAISDFKREMDNLLTADEVKAIRKRLNLTQEKASSIFGGGVRAFHKYETGENTQSRPLDILLKLVNSGKVTIDDIQNLYLQYTLNNSKVGI